MFEIIKKVKNPRFLVITPLRKGDYISKQTLETINNNSTPFDWVSFKSKRNVPGNTKLGLLEYEKQFEKLPYLIKIDNDINASTSMLDLMYQTIKQSEENVAYVYTSFSYVKNGKSVASFPAEKFDFQRLMKSNYISSNSMIKRDSLASVSGFVTDKKYERLLDYALWLKFLLNGYKGEPCISYFEAEMSEKSISARSNMDYQKKMSLIKTDFIDPIIEKIRAGEFNYDV